MSKCWKNCLCQILIALNYKLIKTVGMVPDVKPLGDIVSNRMPVITPTVAVLVIVRMGTPKKHAQMIFLIFYG